LGYPPSTKRSGGGVEPWCEPKFLSWRTFKADITAAGSRVERTKALMPILVLLVKVPKRLVFGGSSFTIINQLPTPIFEQWLANKRDPRRMSVTVASAQKYYQRTHPLLFQPTSNFALAADTKVQAAG
jgi:hypothetical protein